MAKTADRLLEGLKRRFVAPAAQSLLSDDDFLALADDAIAARIVPIMISVREDYLVWAPYLQAITSGTDAYDIHYRAVGRRLRDLKIYDGTSYYDLSLLPIEDAHIWQTAGTPIGFYLRGDQIVLLPSPTVTGYSLQQWLELPPSSLCVLSDAAVVASISIGVTNTTVTVTTAPSTIATGTSVDFIAGKSGNRMRAIDKTVTNVAGTAYTFVNADVPSDLVAGDYVSVAGTSPVIYLPDLAYPLVETIVARRILKTAGDFEGANALKEDEDKEEAALRLTVTPRIQGETKKVMNRHGLLRGRRGSMYRRGIFGS